MGLIAGLEQLSIDLNMVELERAIRRYEDELGIELPKVVRQTFRLILRDVMSITAPESQGQGRKAVARDVNRAIYLLDSRKVHRAVLKSAIEDREYDVIRIILKRMKKGSWSRITAVERFDESKHKSVRDQRGRVQRSKGVATPDRTEHVRYVRKLQGHVGYLRAGWAPGARIAGQSVPSWVARHAPPGTAKDDTNVPNKPTMTAVHDSRGSANLPRALIAKTIERRAKTMHRDVEQVAKGRASRYFK